MFESVLIANRGEIAVRIMRTAKRLGLRTIAVYSQADADALHVAVADEAHLIGPAEPQSSYLNQEKILDVARKAGAACIHPGYGFLAENAGFARACAKAGIVFVGPPPEAIEAMGEKAAAKRLMVEAGVPVVPGYHGDKQDQKTLAREADKVGYPVLIKAVSGGGGKGMRRVDAKAGFADALEGAKREAKGAFDDDRVLIERYVDQPRHVEIQVFADGAGNCIYLFERDCSLQRRHQKVIEEAPAPGISEEVRRAMGEAAVAAANAVGYRGAGTVEFIAAGKDGLSVDGFFFMEMNTRLQVEHPVTEMITGLDLVEWQFQVADGAPLPLIQDELEIGGHAVEARIYAEDPASGFLPATGTVHVLRMPGETMDLRIDAGLEEGGVISTHYDPMIAKLIAWGETRQEALTQLATSLDQTIIAGTRTNIGFLARLVRADAFVDGDFDTGFIDRNLETLIGTETGPAEFALATLARMVALEAQTFDPEQRVTNEPLSPWDVRNGWNMAGARRDRLHMLIDGETVSADITWGDKGDIAHIGFGGACEDAGIENVAFDGEYLSATINGEPARAFVAMAGDAVFVLHRGRHLSVEPLDLLDRDIEAGEGSETIRAPMPGKVLSLLVKKGEKVERGGRVAILEAMKMEHTLTAHADSVVADVLVETGQQVAEGETMLRLKAAESGD